MVCREDNVLVTQMRMVPGSSGLWMRGLLTLPGRSCSPFYFFFFFNKSSDANDGHGIKRGRTSPDSRTYRPVLTGGMDLVGRGSRGGVGDGKGRVVGCCRCSAHE